LVTALVSRESSWQPDFEIHAESTILKYQAITIDTQVVYANKRQLDGGVVAQLEQYKEGPIKFILTEIVLRELISLFEEKAKAPIDALSKTIKDGDLNGQLTVDQKKQLQLVLQAMEAPTDHAQKQLKDFVAKTNAHIVAADTVPMKPILDAYFGNQPPFSNKGKKSEFPDAISLLAIEHWAKSENKKVLAVSKDGDWKTFAKKSEWIDCVDDLAAAMNALLEGVEAIELEGRKIVQGMIDDDTPEIRADLVKFLELATTDESPHVEIESSQRAEVEDVSLTLKDVEFNEEDGDEIDVTLVRVIENGFVLRVPLRLVISLNAEIQFYSYDSVDKDEFPWGTASVEQEIDTEASALVHFSRHEIETEDGQVRFDYAIDNAELVDFPSWFDIGYVEPSNDEEPDDFDPDDWKPEEREDGPQGADAADEKDMPF
jgi:PIN domain